MRLALSPVVAPLVLLAVLASLLPTPASYAQTKAPGADGFGRWQALTAYNDVRAVAASETALWAATDGGVFGYTPAADSVVRYTTVEGLASISPTALAYADGTLWIGHADGALDRLDVASGTLTSFFDIRRTDRFADRAIRRLRLGPNGALYAATAFGIVVFDTDRLEVRDSYTRLATLEAGTAVGDVLLAPLPDGTPGLWAATADGIARAPLDANLLEPSAWALDAEGPDGAVVLAAFEGTVFAGTDEDVRRRRDDDSWEPLSATGSGVTDLLPDGDRLLVLDPFSVAVYTPGAPNQRAFIRSDLDDFADILAAIAEGPDGQIWLGDRRDGLMRLPALSASIPSDLVPDQVVIPDGPLSNQIDDLDVGSDGTLWLGARRTLNRTTVAQRDPDGAWRVFSDADGLPPSSVLSALAADNGSFWGGMSSDGLLHIDLEGAVTVFGPENSTLLPGLSNPDFVPVVDAAEDGDGQIWALNQATQLPVHVRREEEGWLGLPFPANVASRDEVQGLLIDRFDQKWVFLDETGIFVLPAGTESVTGTAPYIRTTGANGIGLPNPRVTALAEDLDGRIWVGTRRGLATIFSPGSAFSGDVSLIEPQWARTEDGTSFFLRDLFVNDIAVDPANNKWLASTSGVWLIDSEGETVLQRFTAADSPLFSDNVVAVDVDPTTGTVYFATDRGVLAYRAEALAAARSVRDLDVAPNPYRPAQHAEGVLITGLVAETRVRILTADGRLVAALDARGGAVRWDGRDRDGRTVPSGVYVVAATGTDGEGTGIGKIAVIR